MEGFIRELKRIVLSLGHSIEAKTYAGRMKGILEYYDSSPVVNERPKDVKSILIIITRMVRFHGGQTSVLRLGTRLCHEGYDVTYISYKPQSLGEMELCARSNLASYKGKLCPGAEYDKALETGEAEPADVVLATSWDTVSVAKKYTGYKMYFVQDYEPYFYPYDERFFLARATYEQGLHMVSLGNWNKQKIEAECRLCSPIDTVTFPCERSEYPLIKRDYGAYSEKKKLVIAVYLKYYGKRLPNIIPLMLKETNDRLKAEGIELDVRYFGESKIFKGRYGKNLGHLTKKELDALYNEADFGMVASMSNISLVPYEMLSTGLPVIEFSDGTYPYFLPADSATLVRVGERDFADKLLSAIKNPKILEKQVSDALAAMEGLGWEKTGKEFAQILKEKVSSERAD